MATALRTSVPAHAPPQPDFARWALLLIVTVTAIRTVGLAWSHLQLHGDEAQYFDWSRDLAAGYFSKPPLIAWVMRGSTELFGVSEWSVRAWSPLAHGLAAGFVFAAARRVWDAQTGFWAALVYLSFPGVGVSSGIASTDALLLACAALSLWAWAELREGGGWPWALVLGAGLGLGFLAKYAVLFFAAGLAGAVVVDARTRAALLRPATVALAGGVTALLAAPNLLWNAQNGFATATHTVANANLAAELLDPLKGLEFIASQLWVAGPVGFVLLVIAISRMRGLAPSLRALAVVAALPLLIITAQAFVSRANANWAVVAYAPGAIVVARCWLGSDWLRAGVAVNAGLCAALAVFAWSPALTDAFGLTGSIKRVRGWDATAAEVARVAQSAGAATVATDHRITFHALDFYRAPDTPPLRMWQMEARPHSHAESRYPLLEGAPEPILFINYYDEHVARVGADFAELAPLPPLEVPLGGGEVRRYDLYLASGYRRAPRN